MKTKTYTTEQRIETLWNRTEALQDQVNRFPVAGQLLLKEITDYATYCWKTCDQMLANNASNLSQETIDDLHKHIFGCRRHSVEFALRGVWGGEVTVTFVLKGDDSELGCHAVADITWSSTGRDLAQATATVALYQQAIQFAALVESILR